MRPCFRPMPKRTTRGWSTRMIPPRTSPPTLPFRPEKTASQPRQSAWIRNTTHLHWRRSRESWSCRPPTSCPSFGCVVDRSAVALPQSLLAATAHAQTAWIYQVNNDDTLASHSQLTSHLHRNIICITACRNTVKHSAPLGLHLCSKTSPHLQAHLFSLPRRWAMAKAFAGRFPVSSTSTSTIDIDIIV